MARSKREILPWMYELAKKHDISVDTVAGIYHSFSGKRYDSRRKYLNREKRTKEFFKLYFEGIKGE